MKALFVGVGSIGKRHICNFYNVCKKNGVIPEIHVMRRKIGDLGDLGDLITKQIIKIDDSHYDVVFITNPTNLHYDALLQCKGKTKWYFIEKPIFESCDYNLSNLGISDTNAYVAAPMRHTTLYKKIKEIVDLKRVFSARVICSSYLPEWRKGVDYRQVYSALKEMGGGVNLDLIHEIDYVYDLFGPPKSVHSVSGKYSDLEISSNDLGVYIFEYKDKLCEVHLDYFGRESVRTCDVFTHEGTYTADFIHEKLIMPNGETVNCHIIDDEEYINEMNCFYKFISGGEKSINPPSLALKTLKIAIGEAN